MSFRKTASIISFLLGLNERVAVFHSRNMAKPISHWWLLVFLLVTLLITQKSTAQTGSPYRLNGDLVAFGDVEGVTFRGLPVKISNNSQQVVYLANQDTVGVDELYSVPIVGGTATKLNTSLFLDQESIRDSFKISNDSQYVVYLANQTINQVRELFSVSIVGGSPERLNPNLPTGGDVGETAQGGDEGGFKISNDSQWVVYVADQDTNNVNELYRVPITGGASVKLNATLVGSGDVDVFGFQISSDSQRVVYLADQDVDNEVELYSVPLTGGGMPVKLNTNNLSGEKDVLDFKISADGQRVIYMADTFIDEKVELFTVPISGGSAIKLNDTLTTAGDVLGFEISADSNWVVYQADPDGNGAEELYSVPIAGGVQQPLNASLVTGGSVRSDYQISKNSQRVVYIADDNIVNVDELYSVPISGGTPTKLHPDFSGSSDARSFDVSNDSQHVVYSSRNPDMLVSVPIAGGSPTLSNSASSAFELQFTPDNKRVIYRANGSSGTELFVAPVLGGDSTRVNTELPFGGADVNYFLVSPNSSHVVYHADQDIFDQNELFAAELLEPEDDGFCLPIKASNGSIAVICL